MDLQALNSPLPKPWLNPQVNTITWATSVGPLPATNSLTLTEVVSVPNPAVGKSVLFADLNGDLKSTDALGNTVGYIEDDGSVPMAADLDLGTNSLIDTTSVVLIDSAGVPNPVPGMHTVYSNAAGHVSVADNLGNTPVLLQDDGKVPMAADLDFAAFSPVNVFDIKVDASANGNAYYGTTLINPGTNGVVLGSTIDNNGGNNNVILGDTISNGGAGGSDNVLQGHTISCAGGSDNVMLGHNISTDGFENVLIGKNITAAPGSNDLCMIGKGNICTVDGCMLYGRDQQGDNNSMLFGYQNIATDESIQMGHGNTSSASGAHILGNGGTNATPNSLLLADGTPGFGLVNVSSGRVGCDIGTQAIPFQDPYFNGFGGQGVSRPVATQWTPVTVGNSGMELTLLSGSVSGSLTIPALSMTTGTMYVATVSGVITSTGADSPTFRLYLGGVLQGTFAYLFTAPEVGVVFNLILKFMCTSIGGGGAGRTIMSLDGPFSGDGSSSTGVVDTTIAELIDITAQWGAANIASTMTAQIVSIVRC